MAKGEGRYSMQKDPKGGAPDKGAERKMSDPPMMASNGPQDKKADIADAGGSGTFGVAFKRHLDERRQMHTRHEREHREMTDRHLKELGGMLSTTDVTGASGVGGVNGEGA